MMEPIVPHAFPLPFKVKDEDGVEWDLRLLAVDGDVVIEQYRFSPGHRIMRDLARMTPDDARKMIKGLERMAGVADQLNVEAVHEG